MKIELRIPVFRNDRIYLKFDTDILTIDKTESSKYHLLIVYDQYVPIRDLDLAMFIYGKLRKNVTTTKVEDDGVLLETDVDEKTYILIKYLATLHKMMKLGGILTQVYIELIEEGKEEDVINAFRETIHSIIEYKIEREITRRATLMVMDERYIKKTLTDRDVMNIMNAMGVLDNLLDEDEFKNVTYYRSYTIIKMIDKDIMKILLLSDSNVRYYPHVTPSDVVDVAKVMCGIKQMENRYVNLLTKGTIKKIIQTIRKSTNYHKELEEYVLSVISANKL